MLARFAINRAALRAPMVRCYVAPVRSEGATASSGSFRTREEAQENQYIRRREEEQLKALRDKAKKAQEEVEAQEKKVAGLPKDE
ncbi:hypothetical protein CspeluHIS016_0503410 [Cutaneotrichosporon spelunceum]|uniref:ATPase inhibitor, mitochondrial n=1 Tax=Cutaneotrichosporon spelunceum TaxID=1672016 RepID=A0AAD3TXH4_9TREE|nr:hypothetical protein CspeluHIS016_0503410 [Cutaneotrichosporon spelunceum]